jgi:hypothetical protein
MYECMHNATMPFNSYLCPALLSSTNLIPNHNRNLAFLFLVYDAMLPYCLSLKPRKLKNPYNTTNDLPFLITQRHTNARMRMNHQSNTLLRFSLLLIYHSPPRLHTRCYCGTVLSLKPLGTAFALLPSNVAPSRWRSNAPFLFLTCCFAAAVTAGLC